MARPFSNQTQISIGFELYSRGYRRLEILEAIGNKRRPSLRTLGNWITKYKGISEDTLQLENQFEWRHMDPFSISWKYATLINRLSLLEKYNPSIRRVRWWCRIQNLYPYYSDNIVISIARRCVVNEHMELFGIPGSDWSNLFDPPHGHTEPLLQLLPGTFAVCFFALDTPLPDWVQNGVFLSIVRNESNILVVCADETIPSSEKISRGWYCLKHIGDEISMKSLMMKLVGSEGIQILSFSNTNYLFSQNLEKFDGLYIGHN